MSWLATGKKSTLAEIRGCRANVRAALVSIHIFLAECFAKKFETKSEVRQMDLPFMTTHSVQLRFTHGADFLRRLRSFQETL
jgi:hypothetical protein